MNDENDWDYWIHMCFMDLEKAFDIVPRNVLEWEIRRKEIRNVLVRSVMSLYEGARIRVRVGSDLSEEFEVKVGYTRDLCCHLFFL